MNEPTLSRLIIDREPEWLRVKDNVSLALMGAMETRLATMSGGKDGEAAKAMRNELEGRIGRIRDKMFEMTTEGFDETLDRTIWGLQTERVDWETRMAQKRKTLPESILSVEEDLQMRRTHNEWYPDEEEEKENEKQLQKEIPPPERHEEVKETFKVVVDNLAEVAKSAPIQLQRAQRAQAVREEISSLPP
uniref:Uncharacterized protein n=1 Tax=Kwoniella dejecticola CBS 10117 TaxID=1296121 RepID=A0A1A5ZYV3_9TREE|nr:uncharacterized protein I303_06545 [Kwoniella dejecticola CBS 10117]OBR82987.1 hypothetical protein I303_06545 [Kwoniella dejecticola CBS 10117]